MRNKLLILIAFVFLFSGIMANTCSTSVGISIKTSYQPDTFQINSTEMWFSFTGDTASTFYINNFINGNFAGINQIDLYSGNCSSLVSILSFQTTDTLIKFKNTFTLGIQYYLKLSRPSGLGNIEFSICGKEGGKNWVDPIDCPLGVCDWIHNPQFNAIYQPNDPLATFIAETDNLNIYDFCGWSNAWGTPNIIGLAAPHVFMYSTNNNAGEAIFTSLADRPLVAGNTYSISFDYFVANSNSTSGVLNFVLSSLQTNAFPLTNAVNLYSSLNETFSSGTLPIVGMWATATIAITPTQNYTTLVLDPQSNNTDFFRLHVDNIRLTDFTAQITANPSQICTAGQVSLTAIPIQTPLNGPYTYLWNTTATTQIINVNTAGVYNVTITNSSGCTATAEYTLLQNSLTATIKPINAHCGNCNGAVDLAPSGGQTPYFFNWTGTGGFTATTEDITNLCPGTYNVTITDAIGCTWTAQTIIVEDIFSGAQWPIVITNSTGNEVVHDMITDAGGNVYAIGTFTGSVTFPTTPTPTTFTNPTGYQYSIFVVKYNKCGIVEVVKNYGGVNTGIENDENYFIEKVTTTTIAVAGTFSGIDFINASSTPTMTSAGDVDVFIAVLNMNTLLATATTQRKIYSTSIENVKGLSVYLNGIYVTGGFKAKDLFFSGFSNVLTSSIPNDYELYIVRYNSALSSLNWAQNYPNAYSDNGMTMKVNGFLYFTYKKNNLTYISRLNSSTGVISTTEQIGTGVDFYNINDMENIGTQLYLCGYKKTNYGATDNKAAVIYYPAPATSIV